MESYCYIIFSKKLNKFYVGSTASFPERLIEHNTGAYGSSKFTAASNDWEEFLLIKCESVSQAKKIEAHIKRMKSSNYILNLKIYPEMISKLRDRYSNT
ncbi:MAG: GIY-YIG nuclease family protein [Flammeovirgaceae bacterium]|nr:GIY-YIG nuclease family protein [Flammeovirgaceae bacterium]